MTKTTTSILKPRHRLAAWWHRLRGHSQRTWSSVPLYSPKGRQVERTVRCSCERSWSA